MTCQACSAKLFLSLLLAVAAASATGCTTVDARKLDLLRLFGPRRPEPPAPGAPAFTIALVPAAGKVDAFPVPLTETVTVQQALEQTGTLSYFRRQDISIERLEPKSRRRHKLMIQFDRNSNRVNPTTDYALLPGDRLVVKEDPSTLIDETIEVISAPLDALR